MRDLQNQIGVSPVTVCVESGVSMSTLYKIYSDDPSVRISTRKKVYEALERLSRRDSAAG